MTRPTYMYRLNTRGDTESRVFDANHDNFSHDTKGWVCSPADLNLVAAGPRKRKAGSARRKADNDAQAVSNTGSNIGGNHGNRA